MHHKVSTLLGAAVMAITLLPMTAAQAQAERRAVVIANDEFESLPPVPGVAPDGAIAAFKAAGFRVVEGRDLPSGEIRRALSDLLRPDTDPGPRVVALLGRFSHSASDTWFLGHDAGRESLAGVDGTGIALSVVMDLMNGGDPHSVLLLGTDQTAFETGDGLHHSLGTIRVPQGVTVIAGYTDGITRAAEVLAKPGATIRQALQQGQSLRLIETAEAQPAGQGGSTPVVVPEAGDEAAWRAAVQAGTATAFRDYLSRFPSGAHVAEARQRLAAGAPPPSPRPDSVQQPDSEEMAAWTRAKRTNSVAGYQDFLGKYPRSIFAGAARGRMGELSSPTPAVENPAAAAEAALKLSRAQRAQIQRQLALLDHDPGRIDGVFGENTRSVIARWQRGAGVAATGYLTAAQVDLIARSAALRSATLERESRERQQAREAADRAYWQQTGQRGGEAGLRSYLQRYPDGLHADRARQLLAELGQRQNARSGEPAAWERAKASGTAAGYRDYLDKFPDGLRAGEARQQLDRLDRQAREDAAAEMALDLDPVALQLVETRLNQMGLNAGKADGAFDAQTRAALRRYQAARDLRASGYLDRGTLVRLLSDALVPGD